MIKKTVLSILLIISIQFPSQVGINTTNPQGVFNIDGERDNPAHGRPDILQQANDIVVTSTGTLGIGTTVPEGKLHIEGGESLFSSSTSKWSLSPTAGGTSGASNSFEIMDKGKNMRRMVFNDNGDISLGGNITSNTSAGIISVRSGNVGLGTGTPTHMLDINGTLRVRTLTQASASTVVQPVYADPNGVLVKASPSPTFGGLISNTVSVASANTATFLNGLVDRGIYKATVTIFDACGNASTAEFLIHNVSFNWLYALNGQGGLVSSAVLSNNRPTFTQTQKSSVTVTWSRVSGCQDGSNATNFNYTLAMPSAGTVNITNNSNITKTYTISLVRLN